MNSQYYREKVDILNDLLSESGKTIYDYLSALNPIIDEQLHLIIPNDIFKELINKILLSLQQKIDDFGIKYRLYINYDLYYEIISDIKKVYFILYSSILNTSCGTNIGNNNNNTLTYVDTSIEHSYILDIPEDKYIYITMVGGGGAAGICTVNNAYFYVPSGGGSSAVYIKKPVYVKNNTELKIKIGKGGNINTNTNGESTVITVKYPDNSQIVFTAHGGHNGHPNIESPLFSSENVSPSNDYITGGLGGISEFNNYFNGNNGESGEIIYPSQQMPSGGKLGGISHFDNTQIGNMFNNILFLQNIKYGSGGGSNITPVNLPLNLENNLSSNGNSGIVIIDV